MLEPNRFYQRCDLGASQALVTNEDNGRTTCGCDGENLGEVSIEGDDRARFTRRVCEDRAVGCFLHSQLRYVHGVPPKRSQKLRRRERHTLIK